jgi:hypothetical protein
MVLSSFCRTYSRSYNIRDKGENTIVEDCLVPFFGSFFTNNYSKMTTYGADCVIQRFAKLDSILKKHNKIADYSNLSQYLIFALEAKSVSGQGKSKEDLNQDGYIHKKCHRLY